MKISLIIAVYKDVESLELIIESLRNQTYKNFEVIIAEDGNSEEMKKFISSLKGLEIIHTTQEDIGVRKSHSQNNAIKSANGEYLIFIDGDCILYSNFIENHLKLSSPKCIISGRRVNLGLKYSTMLRKKEISSLWLEKNFVKKYFDIAKDAKIEKHTEEGIQIKPFSFLHKILHRKYKNKELSILGCNFSCYKQAMLDINGFDEELGNSAYAGDTDLEWRFRALGYKIISAKYIANQFHLFHKRKKETFARGMLKKIEENKKNNIYFCRNGLNYLSILIFVF
ncbi:glycosyltransferase [Aliarcobacter butzleri]|uniref:glycosyltransferase n=1 Tax=Aliarcobacter butzleri TaxID=28197 RepID=UPI00125F017E|nr:glycosyltransferase [Aliarcobacter butzleri]MCT7569079.1 glycosyltransferase [Aliarcobacter butzleri]MDY0193303.1 glycosyltransferase [Aliarcobacter butzleri]